VEKTLLFLFLSFWIFSASGAGDFSDLWGKDGEKWGPAGRLPDFSFAGYHRGGVPIPEPAVSADIKRDFGAAGDGKTDDTDAFLKAAAEAKGVVFVPPGEYRITKIIEIRRPNVVFRGAGPDKTVLFFPVPLQEVKPNWGSTTSGRNTSNYSWSGGFFHFRGRFIGKRLASVVKESKRGSFDLTLDDASKLEKGMEVVLRMIDDGKSTLFDYLYSGDPGDHSKFRGRVKVVFVAKIVSKSGTAVRLDRPLPADVAENWSPTLLAFSPTVFESGVEDLSFEFPNTPYKGHFTEMGYNALAMNGAANCWIRNVEIRNADSGVFIGGSVFCSISGLVVKSERKPWRGFTGHHCVELDGYDNLCEKFDFRTRFIHDLGVSMGSRGVVYSEGKGVDLNFDHHKRAPYQNLYTDIDVGAGTDVWKCGGGRKLGRNCGARETFWDIRSKKSLRYPPEGFGPKSMNFVGVSSDSPSIKEPNGKWFEAIPPGDLEPGNLYKAQLARRKKDRSE